MICLCEYLEKAAESFLLHKSQIQLLMLCQYIQNKYRVRVESGLQCPQAEDRKNQVGKAAKDLLEHKEMVLL